MLHFTIDIYTFQMHKFTVSLLIVFTLISYIFLVFADPTRRSSLPQSFMQSVSHATGENRRFDVEPRPYGSKDSTDTYDMQDKPSSAELKKNNRHADSHQSWYAPPAMPPNYPKQDHFPLESESYQYMKNPTPPGSTYSNEFKEAPPHPPLPLGSRQPPSALSMLQQRPHTGMGIPQSQLSSRGGNSGSYLSSSFSNHSHSTFDDSTLQQRPHTGPGALDYRDRHEFYSLRSNYGPSHSFGPYDHDPHKGAGGPSLGYYGYPTTGHDHGNMGSHPVPPYNFPGNSARLEMQNPFPEHVPMYYNPDHQLPPSPLVGPGATPVISALRGIGIDNIGSHMSSGMYLVQPTMESVKELDLDNSTGEMLIPQEPSGPPTSLIRPGDATGAKFDTSIKATVPPQPPSSNASGSIWSNSGHLGNDHNASKGLSATNSTIGDNLFGASGQRNDPASDDLYRLKESEVNHMGRSRNESNVSTTSVGLGLGFLRNQPNNPYNMKPLLGAIHDESLSSIPVASSEIPVPPEANLISPVGQSNHHPSALRPIGTSSMPVPESSFAAHTTAPKEHYARPPEPSSMASLTPAISSPEAVRTKALPLIRSLLSSHVIGTQSNPSFVPLSDILAPIWSLLKGNILEVAKDQHGSEFLLRILRRAICVWMTPSNLEAVVKARKGIFSNQSTSESSSDSDIKKSDDDPTDLDSLYSKNILIDEIIVPAPLHDKYEAFPHELSVKSPSSSVTAASTPNSANTDSESGSLPPSRTNSPTANSDRQCAPFLRGVLMEILTHAPTLAVDPHGSVLIRGLLSAENEKSPAPPSNNALNANSNQGKPVRPPRATPGTASVVYSDLQFVDRCQHLSPPLFALLVIPVLLPHVLKMSFHLHGCRVLQQVLIACPPSSRRKHFFAMAMSRFTCPYLYDANGNHVLQALIVHYPGGSTHAIMNQDHIETFETSPYVSVESENVPLPTVVEESIITSTENVAEDNTNTLDDVMLHYETVRVDSLFFFLRNRASEAGKNKIPFPLPGSGARLVTLYAKNKLQAWSIHPFGCRIVQRLIEQAELDDTNTIMAELQPYFHSLATEQFGNFVCQRIFTHGPLEARSRLVKDAILGRLLNLATHKYASNVVERALEHASDEDKVLLVGEVLGELTDLQKEALTAHLQEMENVNGENVVQPPPPSNNAKLNAAIAAASNKLQVLLSDQFGNYVAQRLFDAASDDQRNALALLLLNSDSGNVLSKAIHGRHMLVKLTRMAVEGKLIPYITSLVTEHNVLHGSNTATGQSNNTSSNTNRQENNGNRWKNQSNGNGNQGNNNRRMRDQQNAPMTADYDPRRQNYAHPSMANQSSSYYASVRHDTPDNNERRNKGGQRNNKRPTGNVNVANQVASNTRYYNSKKGPVTPMHSQHPVMMPPPMGVAPHPTSADYWPPHAPMGVPPMQDSGPPSYSYWNRQ